MHVITYVYAQRGNGTARKTVYQVTYSGWHFKRLKCVSLYVSTSQMEAVFEAVPSEWKGCNLDMWCDAWSKRQAL